MLPLEALRVGRMGEAAGAEEQYCEQKHLPLLTLLGVMDSTVLITLRDD